MAQGRRGVTVEGVTGRFGLTNTSLRAPQAKVMHRFLGGRIGSMGASVLGWWIPRAFWKPVMRGSMSMLPRSDDFWGSNNGGMPVRMLAGKTLAGRGGLGVSVRDGLVRPPSLVNSAVDARLPLLLNDRLRKGLRGG